MSTDVVLATLSGIPQAPLIPACDAMPHDLTQDVDGCDDPECQPGLLERRTMPPGHELMQYAMNRYVPLAIKTRAYPCGTCDEAIASPTVDPFSSRVHYELDHAILLNK
jgi:hypothetical protein